MKPRVTIGMLVYNGERHVAEAISSLLEQTYPDFNLVILDDCSTDRSEQIVRGYLARDDRIVYVRNEVREGYVPNYRRVFAQADKDVEYFAWAADHDVHHRDWLCALVAVLDANPDVVMAYPLTVRIGDQSEVLPVPSPTFETVGMNAWARVREISWQGAGFGNMIYGLFRAEYLRRAGVYRDCLIPDMLLLAELSRYGTILQVRRELWYRRYAGLFSVKRQRENAFARPRWYLYLPWPLVNTASLVWNVVVGPHAGSLWERCLGLRLTFWFCVIQTYRWAKSTLAERLGSAVAR